MSGDLVQERVEAKIRMVRGEKVLLDLDLAPFYGVGVGRLNEALRRNLERFPEDFAFQLTRQEHDSLKSQIAFSKVGRGGRRSMPWAFTEQGVAMLSGVLRSKRAVQVNIEIVRAFVKLRKILSQNHALAKKLAELEKHYDGQFKIVFEAIRQLMASDATPKRKIGFR